MFLKEDLLYAQTLVVQLQAEVEIQTYACKVWVARLALYTS